ncbi:MAG: 4-diphosphocytidyl-2C-methyl-D-erythritol synthase [Methylocystis sp.]|nr:MAG: 4-diphosphocytidyl-2C-methyl-D-erythritol synthase [Methylocystis sp.]
MVASLVLAAGRGARFGEGNKLLADVHGKPLLRHVVETALASRASPTIVVTGHERAKVEAALAGLSVTFAHNAAYASGLASSLRVGLEAVTGAEGALVLLGDMPRVQTQTLDALIAAFEAAPACPAVVPANRGRRGNPALLGRALFSAAIALQGDEGARRLLRAAAAVVEVEVEDAGILLDIDTRDDLTRL